MNPLYKAYFAIDDALVNGAGQAVHVWEKLGGTKKSLADLVTTVGLGAAVTSEEKNFLPKAAMIGYSLFTLFKNHLADKASRSQDEDSEYEAKAINIYDRVAGATLPGYGMLNLGASVSKVQSTVPHEVLRNAGIWGLVTGISSYIMRAKTGQEEKTK